MKHTHTHTKQNNDEADKFTKQQQRKKQTSKHNAKT